MEAIEKARIEYHALLSKLMEFQPEDVEDYKDYWQCIADTFEGQAQVIRKGLIDLRVAELMREEDQMKKRLAKNKQRRKG